MGITTGETLRISWSRDRAFYVFSEQQLRQNISDLRNAFTKYYKNFSIAYSYKTNYLRRICETAKEEGCLAEVVSPWEMRYAEEVGYRPGPQIVYNGLIPDRWKPYYAARGVLVNIDSMDEFERLEKDVACLGVKHMVGIGIRLNFDIGNDLISRFGVDTSGEDLKNLLYAIDRSGRFFVNGFHCHIGCSRDPKYWEAKITALIDIAREHDVKYIDVGGGMYGVMPEELARQFCGYPGNFDAYAGIIGKKMKEAYPEEKAKLVIEPGTALVGNTMDVVAEVTGIKEVRGKTYITVNCCSNQLGVICDVKDIPVDVVPMSRGQSADSPQDVEDAIIAGDTCLEFDYLRKGFSGRIAVGDKLVFSNVGAYSIGASRQFISPRLAVIDAETGQELRSEEQFLDMFGLYLAK